MKKINKAILKEYKAMSLHSFSDGQIEVDFPNENDLTEVRVFLKPNAGFYKDGKFQFAVKLPEDYPSRAPSVSCKTKMFHPNINYEGRICFNILADEWEESLRLVDYVHSLLWLLYQPNLDSRLNGDCPQNVREFEQLVRKSIVGGTIRSQHFECTLADPAAYHAALAASAPAAGTRIVRPIASVTIRNLRDFFEGLNNPAPQPPVQRTQPQPVVPQPQEQPAVPQQPQEPTPVVQAEPQQAAEVVAPQEQAIAPEQPQQQPQPQEQQPAIPEQPAAPQQPPQPQEQPAVPQQPQQVTPVVRPRPQVVPLHMRWAQFILPSVHVQQPQRPQQNTTVRRWAPVTPPIRFAGAIRVY